MIFSPREIILEAETCLPVVWYVLAIDSTSKNQRTSLLVQVRNRTSMVKPLHSMWAPDKKKSSIDLGFSPMIPYTDAAEARGSELVRIRREIDAIYFLAVTCEDVLERIWIIPEKSMILRSYLALLRVRWVWVTCAWFLYPRSQYLSSGEDPRW